MAVRTGTHKRAHVGWGDVAIRFGRKSYCYAAVGLAPIA